MKTYYSSRRAAELLNKSHRTINRWLQNGRFPNAGRLDPDTRYNPQYVIPKKDIDALRNNK